MQSANLIFERLEERHFADYASWYGNAAVMRYITGEAMAEDAIRKRFASARKDNKLFSKVGWFLTFSKTKVDFVGITKLTLVPGEDFVAEVGYGSLPQFWGQGLGNEMLDTMIALAKDTAGIHELIGIVHHQNAVSKSMLTKREFRLASTTNDGVETLRLFL